jgi:hypothetical protein
MRGQFVESARGSDEAGEKGRGSKPPGSPLLPPPLAGRRKQKRIASIHGVDEDRHNVERQGFAYWSGYQPGKRNPDGSLAPLNQDELRAEAARFRRGALRARERGDVAQAARLEVAANDFERRADQATEG